ncbi:KTSC domain-containing protein [Actinokineospora alba]|uniref:KTSC domain-containing protein n=1 Tax=Actinokineospora alba TaxID=504798 RepID=A0A1H0S152_9PSEU|nr:KTSC domain-containing protein [Actinokineospora alba]TDP66817.1 KTSC domain-containing protein [Actinokineospora alba]SDI48832.1 KTSC domain-containing protein [Actinokineospora alba]SDP35424.1 KTSC domain-containing protein [Actinokineospora alba]
MRRQALASASVASVGYDAATETLEVEFRNGNVYQYLGVAKRLYWGLMSAPSVGAFLNREIRDSHEFLRVR